MAAMAGKRERTKAVNRTAILVAAREVFSDLGYGSASVRDIVRATDLATGTFYNYFPDKEAVLRALVDEIAVEARARVRAARAAARSVDGFVAEGFRAYFEFLAKDRATLALMRRNAGTIRALFNEPAIGAGVEELRDDLEAAVAAGALPTHDADLMAAAMVGAGIEVGMRMVERDPPDVEGAVAFVTDVFLGALERMRRRGFGVTAPKLLRG
jgi:AcrR family transcriptional regulator